METSRLKLIQVRADFMTDNLIYVIKELEKKANSSKWAADILKELNKRHEAQQKYIQTLEG